MEDSKFLDAALQYIEHGMSVVILGKHGKKTTTVHTPNGLLDATKDPDVAKSWWETTPKCNVGIVCGRPSGNIIVVDVDTKRVDGYSNMRDWEMEHGDMPETVTCCTPTGGYHFYYRADREVRPSVNEDLGIDIRGDGSFAVAPPSIHPDTLTEYVWEFAPGETAIADANDLVYEFIEYVRPKGGGSGEAGEHQHIDASKFEKGNRNNQLYKMACSMMAQSWDDDAIISSIETYNAMSKNPLPKGEVDTLLKSALKLPKGKSEAYYKGELNQSDGGRSKPANHVDIAMKMLGKYSACYLDGAPAVFDGLSYKIGWHEVERMILREWPNSKDRDRKEVIKYLDLVMPRESQSPPRYIGFTNGVLDIETMDLMSFSPEFRIPNVIPHDWNPEAHSDVFDATMRRIACNDPFIESNLMEFIGLCMYRSGKYAFAAVLLGRQGKTAANGKSTYIDMIRAVLGEDNYSSLSLRALGDRFNQGYLAGKLANLGDDISSEFTDGSSLEVFKKAVAGSKINTDVKNSKGYEFTPYCTIIFSANKFPKMEKLDDGTLRRLFPIRFNAHFTKDDPDFDPDIGEKLKAEECIEAAIVRGVWGLRRVISQRGPTDNDESQKMLRDIEIDNSSILQWIEDDFVSHDKLVGVETKHAYQEYSKWCYESGVRKPFGKKQFASDVCDRFGFKVKNTSRDYRSVRIFADR